MKNANSVIFDDLKTVNKYNKKKKDHECPFAHVGPFVMYSFFLSFLELILVYVYGIRLPYHDNFCFLL